MHTSYTPQQLREMAEAERYERIDSRIRRHPEFDVWVASGGLQEFAAEHNLQPNFVDSLENLDGKLILAYFARLRTVPGLREEMVHTRGRPTRPMIDKFVQAAMAEAEGWDIDDDDDDDHAENDNDTETKDAGEGTKGKGSTKIDASKSSVSLSKEQFKKSKL
jgi:hypothetical protein